ncbi:Cmx/CmrA family chloramphenicol efflux MFS transporter [Kribbella solani]|uniref:DHA1 family chloramphenicol resistance protein-like MFS transporter n=1 Tax=Kribbella solani TaxID=236067 RepID=A0A841DI37_9ACTN|nr:Cmx/CmrA family chloramphenicol efflux MFS transporter [Kribbella solani]MBB5978203.1 DHA1 family chloramphenicol resistance protein-like MFS transporter [Kribbella solani]MDX2968029.1 MFS transporter [Kribbella solani]MDX3005443.1 MFS transporter [Kribbella solani]
MPIAVYVLGLSIFAQGTSELMLAGLLPELAADLHVTIPQAGLLISAFAAGMLVGAPVLAVVTLTWSRRTALLVFLTIFALTHVAGALTPNYTVLLVTRIVGAFVYAGFWSVAAVTVVALVRSGSRARAMSIVTGGLTIATIVGLPLGTVLGQHLGWRSAFWTVAGLCVLAMAGVVTTVPAGRPDPATAPRLADELRALVNARLWLAFGTTALVTATILVLFSYLAPLLTGATHLPAGAVPGVLALYGLGSFIGITLGGRFADALPFHTLFISISGLIVLSAVLALAAGSPLVAIPVIVLLGGFGFAANPALNARVFSLAGDRSTLATATNFSAFNVGITAGPWLGGIAIDAGTGYPALGWIAVATGTAALATVLVAVFLPVSSPGLAGRGASDRSRRAA